MISKLWPAFVALGVAATAIGGSLFVMGYLSAHPSNGTLAVMVHDSPCSQCAHVWVTFQSVAVHHSNTTGGGWTTLNVSGSTLDLATLNGSAMAKTIGVASLPAGHYEQIRLTVSSVVVGLSNGTNLSARIPNASSANVNGAFNISSGTTTNVSIDIDLQSSLHFVDAGPVLMATFTPNIGSVVVVG